MQIDGPIDEKALTSLGAEAVRLLRAGDITTLASRFGYALANGREAAAAIEEDLSGCLGGLSGASLAPTLDDPPASVKYFEPNNSGLIAVVECLVLTESTGKILLELVVTGNEAERHVTLEQISVAA